MYPVILCDSFVREKTRTVSTQMADSSAYHYRGEFFLIPERLSVLEKQKSAHQVDPTVSVVPPSAIGTSSTKPAGSSVVSLRTPNAFMAKSGSLNWFRMHTEGPGGIHRSSATQRLRCCVWSQLPTPGKFLKTLRNRNFWVRLKKETRETEGKSVLTPTDLCFGVLPFKLRSLLTVEQWQLCDIIRRVVNCEFRRDGPVSLYQICPHADVSKPVLLSTWGRSSIG